MGSGRSLELRVGIFVTLALLVGSGVVFTLGNQSSLFASRRHYHAIFGNVDGLRPGATIRMAGIDVGTVSSVTLRGDGRCDVVLGVVDAHTHFITAESRATIGSKGLLGDKLVEVTPGTGPELPDQGEITTSEGGGIFGALATAGDAIDEARPAIANIRRLTETLAEEQLQQDIRDIAHNFAELTRMVREDDGTVHRLISDPELADSIESTLGSVRVATAELAATSRNIRAITGEIRSGDGSVHDLIYEDGASVLVANLADTAGEAASILRDVRTGDGNAHELLYGDSAGDLITNLTAMSEDLRVIIADVRAGRGTLGGLLTDPSIYEDIRRVVGNLERNEILRALVRYSIREDEPRDPPVDVTEEADAP